MSIFAGKGTVKVLANIGVRGERVLYLLKFIYGTLLFPPGLFILILLIIGLWAYRRNRKIAKLILGVAGLIYLASTSLVANAVIHSLEYRYTPPDKYDYDTIVVLGAGATLDTPNIGGQGHVSGYAANRLLTALTLYQKLSVPIIVSGGKVFATTGVEAEISRTILTGLGVPPERVLLENASLNTTQNAYYSANIIRQNGFTKPVLVTSAFHMERAVLQFAKAGITVTPFPTDYQTNRENNIHITDLLPSAYSLHMLTLGLKEWLGIAFIKWY
jgi:uncharacterized SAM-binding protein YcdF (DUF218 family)